MARIGYFTSPVPGAGSGDPLAGEASHRAAYVEALAHERDEYRKAGQKDRTAAVETELERVASMRPELEAHPRGDEDPRPYIEALQRERAAWSRLGRKDMVALVDADLRHVGGGSA